jgi:hypothetical protein
LYYFNARWYDPTLGRFITEDPIKDGVNWFAYVSNNPLNRIDPTGLKEIVDTDKHGNPLTERDVKRNQRKEIDGYNDRIRNARSIAEAKALEEEQLRKMGEYNRSYFNDYTSQDRIPGRVRETTDFLEEIEIYDSERENFYGAKHGGSDNVGVPGQQEYTPYYVKPVYAEGNTVVYDVIGMDRFIGGSHITSDEVNRMAGEIGKILSPRDPMHRHPAYEEGDPTFGRHEHNFEYDSMGRFYNPDTHQLPEAQPEQWRREAQGFKSKPIPGAIIGDGPWRYKIPYLP